MDLLRSFRLVCFVHLFFLDDSSANCISWVFLVFLCFCCCIFHVVSGVTCLMNLTLNFKKTREKNMYKAVVVVLAFYARPFETLRITPKLGFFQAALKVNGNTTSTFRYVEVFTRAKDTSWLLLDINLCYLQQFSVILLSNFFVFFFLMLKAIRL